jgi:hypothetical protein
MSYADFHERTAAPRDIKCDMTRAGTEAWPRGCAREADPSRSGEPSFSVPAGGAVCLWFYLPMEGANISKLIVTIRRQPKAQAVLCENRKPVGIIRPLPRSS